MQPEAVEMELRVNGSTEKVKVLPNQTLLEVLREKLGLTGVKEGCGEGACGACTVLVDGLPRRACLTLALEAEARPVVTVEGLGKRRGLSDLQEAFIEKGAIQCGFCTPGMLISAHHFLQQKENPSETEIRTQLGGHICRCTGYAKIVEAITFAALKLQEQKESSHAS
ncbi:(2Fe-2S)-binding protein [Dethiosulfatarculus sandiegensis]|uniref:2Fe-2S ferredoxin-type domain-containing protein n=1 Tax=Dethiosulfatarculus sandiegensis TaxID=1429043 RepID=A0A0D2GBT5_9BACT|nr:(2Fe-2S)-binding protein [Dethiosulfatarculus sandiegensis]KIX12357.1 hypothetical protein X474_19345 [Dethiosulfatarculus sandiegensis]